MFFQKMESLRSQIRSKVADFREYNGVRGLYLRLDFLRAVGVPPATLEEWELGIHLQQSPDVPLWKKNHPSLCTHREEGEAELQKLAELHKLDWLQPASAEARSTNVNPGALISKITPDGVIKNRFIMDLRRGGVNARLPHWPVQYGCLDEVTSIIRRNDWLFVIDLADAFLNWKVHPDSCRELGIRSPKTGLIGRYAYLPFGLATAPHVHVKNLAEVLQALQRCTGITVIPFVDDMVGGDSSPEESWKKMTTVVNFFLEAGIPVSIKEKGLRPPAQAQTWIGWVLDTANDLLQVEPRKITDLTRRWEETVAEDRKGTLRAKQLARTVGLANHVAEIWPQSRLHLRAIWGDLQASGAYAAWREGAWANPHAPLSPESHEEIKWWCEMLQSPPQRPLFPQGGKFADWAPDSQARGEWQQLAAGNKIRLIRTDAAKATGWSYHVGHTNRLVAGTWPAAFEAASSNYKEMWTAVEALRREQKDLRGWRVMFRVDNSTSVHYINRRQGRIPGLCALAREMELAERKAMCWAAATHVKGILNVVADTGSRNPHITRQWNTDPSNAQCIKRSLFDKLQKDTGMRVDTDLFADNEGVYAMASEFFCASRSVFEADLTGKTCWAQPPSPIVKPFIKWLRTSGNENRVNGLLLLCPTGLVNNLGVGYCDRIHQVQTWGAGTPLFVTTNNGKWVKDKRTQEPFGVYKLATYTETGGKRRKLKI